MSGYSTAGAVPVVNEKGQITMQKVKVTPYQPGKKPNFANESSSEESSEYEDNDNYKEEPIRYRPPRREEFPHVSSHVYNNNVDSYGRRDRDEYSSEDNEPDCRPQQSYRSQMHVSNDVAESRLARLQSANESYDARLERRRALLEEADLGVEQVPVGEKDEDSKPEDEFDDDEVEEDEEEAIRRRQRLREMARSRQVEELMAVGEDQEEESGSEEDEEVSEYEEYDDEEDDLTARLKPVFVRKKDRVTLNDEEEDMEYEEDEDEDGKRIKDERKKVARQIVEEEVKREIQAEREAKAAAAAAASGGVPIPAAIASLAAASANKHPGVEGNFNYGAIGLDKHIDADNMTLVAMSLEDVITDDEGGEAEYDKWKLRELKRIKRDREEREALLRDREEIEAVHNMTEDERKAYFAVNQKIVTNKAERGKYRFLQKYYHRGVFYLDKDESVLKRDICEPTLEDKFDRKLMPQVMQVKNFGKKGRTKYTHLVDQDTTGKDAAWIADSAASQRWHQTHGGGTRQVFNRPTTSKKKQ